jgi:hypothetical protein
VVVSRLLDALQVAKRVSEVRVGFFEPRPHPD